MFADKFVDENNRKLSNYRENIPNFEPTIVDMVTSITNIKTTLENISCTNKILTECCEVSCMNCSPANMDKFLGKSQSVLSEDASHEPTSQNQENVLSSEKIDQKGAEAIKKNDMDIRLVAQVSEQEFKTIPKYQLGRLTRENLNEIVQKMDEFLSKKSIVFGKSNKQLTRIDRELIDNWRELELKAKGRLPTTLFFIENDIRPLLQERLRPSFAKAIPCLRHIRRVREERCGPLTFYYS